MRRAVRKIRQRPTLGTAALLAMFGGVVLAPATARASFGFQPGPEGFSITAIAQGGGPETAAGGHPYDLNTKIALNAAPQQAGQPGVFTEGDIRDLHIELPRGLIGNPDAVPKCRSAEFNTPRESPFEESASGESCPQGTQIGVATIKTSAGGGRTRTFGVFNLAPPPGIAAAFGFAPYGVPLVFYGEAHTGPAGEYTLVVEAQNIHQALDLYSLEMTIWGVPWGVSHDGQRGNCLNEQEPAFPWAKCASAGVAPVPFLSMPTYCGTPLVYSAYADSWQDPTHVSARSESPALESCETVPFDPQAVGAIVNPRTSSPTGFEFVLTNNNEGLLGPIVRTPSQTKTAVVSLPEGVTLNPSVGAGLGVCTTGQYEAETAFSPPGAGCPNNSKIGELTVESPLYENPIGGETDGAIYLAKPYDNPFGTLLAVYLVAKLPVRGILVKLPGKLVPDLSTGQLTATFEDLPQLPYTNLKIFFREGQRAPLVTPSTCGTYYTYSALTPWLGSLGEFTRRAYSTIEQGIGGGPCPTGGAAPFEPTAKGGTLDPVAGAYSPFYLHLQRTDSQQEFTTYSMVLPPGMIGKIAGLTYCPDAAIEAAKRMSGIEEREHPSCPASSEIGHTTAGYGVGPALTYSPGKVYLAGPYHGSSFSLVAIDSALVGPFDLGVVIVRSAIHVDPYTAQVSIDSAGSDPIPHIIDGIPIHLRDIRVYIDRPQTTLNPTSCEPFTLTSIMTGSAAPFTNPEDITASVPDHFQAANCDALGFAPHLTFGMRGARRGQYPVLTATVTARPGDANVAGAVVTLPHAEFLAQEHIVTACAKSVFEAHSCPAGSIYGHASVRSPLIEEAWEGPVYLVSGFGHRIPDMVVALHGKDGLEVDLDARVDQVRGGMRASFEALPDAPASTFELTLFGGRRGLLVNSENICKAKDGASVRFIGQNSLGYAPVVRLENQCGKKHHKKHHKRRRR